MIFFYVEFVLFIDFDDVKLSVSYESLFFFVLMYYDVDNWMLECGVFKGGLWCD